MTTAPATNTFDELSGSLDQLSPWRAATGRPVGDRRFSVWLVLAAAVHLLFLVGLYTAPVRQLGDPGGADDGVSVQLVTAAEADGQSTVPEEAAGAPSPSIAAPEQAPSPPPTPPVPEPAPAVAATPPPAPSPPAAETAPEPPPQAASKSAAEAAPALDPDLLKLDAAALPEKSAPPAKAQDKQQEKPPEEPAAKATKSPNAKPQDAKPRPPRPEQPRQQTAKLDLSMPPSMMRSPGGGGGAGVSRPPGTTRSGENDAFFLGVIRALQTAMPQLRDTIGMVTVRIFIDKNGNLVRTEVLTPSGVPGLDQSVVFSTKQASFPFPPHNAVAADLEFRVRYIYR